MVSLPPLGVLARRLSLQLNEDAVQELGHLLAAETSFPIGDENFHRTEVSDPVRHDRLDEVLRLPPFQQRTCCPPDSFIEQVADHQLSVEQYIPLNHLVDVMGESHSRERLRRRSRPHPADPAGVHDLLNEPQCFMRSTGRGTS